MTKGGDRPVKLAHSHPSVAEIAVRLGKIGLKRDGVLKGSNGIVYLPGAD